MKSKRLCKGVRKEKLKMKTKRMCKAEPSASDIISTLPQNILETILCHLSTRDAARTSILSREWRYKWTTIPKLEFGHFINWHKGIRCTAFCDLDHVLLLRQGPIHELALHACEDCDFFEFDQILLHLSNNHKVKKFTVEGQDSKSRCDLPISVFSLRHLTDLDLCYCDLDHQPIFTGFGSLRSLSLRYVGISTTVLLHLLSNCPSLKSLDLLLGEPYDVDRYCTIIELFKCLPVVEHLKIWGPLFMCKWLLLDSVPQELPTTLFHLKYFCFEEMCFNGAYGLGFLLVLIKCSPNLEKIKLEIELDYYDCEEYSVVWEEYSDVWLEHLNELEIDCLCYTKLEMKFVMFILSRSPKLKKVRMRNAVDIEEELDHDGFEEYSVVWEEYSDVWLEHLNDLKIDSFSCTKLEMKFVMFILARSPKLKMVRMRNNVVARQEKLDHDGFEEYSVVWEEYSDVSFEHLNEWKINSFSNTKLEMEFVKFILARSPNLEKMSLKHNWVPTQKRFEMLEVLLQAPRASPARIYISKTTY